MLKLQAMLLRFLLWIGVTVVLTAPERLQFLESFQQNSAAASLHATVESSFITDLGAAIDLGVTSDDFDDSLDGATPSSQTVTLADVLRLRAEVSLWGGGASGFWWAAIQERGPPTA